MALFEGNLEGGMGCQKGVQGLSFTYNDVSGKDSVGWGRSMEFLVSRKWLVHRQLRGRGISSGLSTKPSNPSGAQSAYLHKLNRILKGWGLDLTSHCRQGLRLTVSFG